MHGLQVYQAALPLEGCGKYIFSTICLALCWRRMNTYTQSLAIHDSPLHPLLLFTFITSTCSLALAQALNVKQRSCSNGK